MEMRPILSVVTPTLGKFSEFWLEQLLQIKGSVQWVLCYPTNVPIKPIEDDRVKVVVSPYKGEMMQRFIGLLNADGEYVLALDDDDLAHPDIVGLIEGYFQRFPDSLILRLQKLNIDMTDQDRIKQPWEPIPDIHQLEVSRKTPENPFPYQQGNFKGLLEVPIAPLDINFDLRRVFLPFTPRQDNEGYHFENFNNIVWKNQAVQAALPDLAEATKVLGTITWIPKSGFDRLLGLFVQAKFFENSAVIGHWVPKPEQIRYIDKDPALKPPRFHVLSDVLLVKYFPQYGYFWNLFFSKLYGVPRTAGKLIKWNLRKKK